MKTRAGESVTDREARFQKYMRIPSATQGSCRHFGIVRGVPHDQNWKKRVHGLGDGGPAPNLHSAKSLPALKSGHAARNGVTGPRDLVNDNSVPGAQAR